MSPYRSLRQERFFHSKTGLKKIGKAKVAEWDAESKGKKLPEKARKRAKKK